VLTWQLSSFADLGVDALYDLLQLRSIVFVVEQTCVFLDIDGKDKDALHLLGRDEAGRVVAYARLIAPGATYEEPCIGRVVTHPDVRKTGAGRELMTEAVRHTTQQFGDRPIRIGAQRYLEKFYRSFGFSPVGMPYDEDGIEHIEMLL